MIFFTDFFANNLVVYQKTLVFSICFLESFHYQSTSLYLLYSPHALAASMNQSIFCGSVVSGISHPVESVYPFFALLPISTHHFTSAKISSFVPFMTMLTGSTFPAIGTSLPISSAACLISIILSRLNSFN